MRVLIHCKIEQVMEQASLWTKIMPQKIFTDLVTFCAEPASEKPAKLNSTQQA